MKYYYMEEKHVEECAKITYLQYREECVCINSLPLLDDHVIIENNLKEMVKNKLHHIHTV